MKTIRTAGSLLAVLLLTLASYAQTEQLTVPLSEPGKAFTLNIGLVNGSIKVTGYDGKDIIIDAQVVDKRKGKDGSGMNVNVNVNIQGKDKESSSGMKKIGGGGSGMELSVEERNNKVTVNSDSWKRPIDLVIKVPVSAGKYKLNTVNDGNIVISGINGEFEVENVNGAVTLTDVSGSVVASTINGNMIVTLKTVDPKAPMAFTTLNGRVDVTIPGDTKINLKAKSERGDVYSDFDVTIDKTTPKVTRSAEKGMYRINIEDWVQGKINGGGPEVLMKTMNGNIYLRKAK